MRRFLQSRAIGRPQFLAAGLLLVYLLECLWLVRAQAVQSQYSESHQLWRAEKGWDQWHVGVIAGTPESFRNDTYRDERPFPPLGEVRIRNGFDEDRSPLYYLTAGAPMLVLADSWITNRVLREVVATTPYLFFGVMLGGSLWYVARRLYGNAGGYIALTLYCFSPAMIVNVAGWQSLGEMGAAWGAFGTIWTAVAVAHTLYAPREVVLWNWRRILLLGLSIALTVGNQFSLAMMVAVALFLMLWVAPVRKAAALAIWAAAVAVGMGLIVASYRFHPVLFGQGMAHARWFDFDWNAFTVFVSCRRTVEEVLRGSPPMMLLLPIAVVVFAVWRRARYFGNTAPFIVATWLLLLGTANSGFRGLGFHLAALTFVFVFVAGIFTDLLETRRGFLTRAALSGLLIASAAWNMVALARAG